MSVVLGKNQLEELSLNLAAIEDWMRDGCSARHADVMADVIHQAWQVVDDLADEVKD